MYREKGCVRIDMGAWGLGLDMDSFSKQESFCRPFSGAYGFLRLRIWGFLSSELRGLGLRV